MDQINVIGLGRSGTNCIHKWFQNQTEIKIKRKESQHVRNHLTALENMENETTFYIIRDWYNLIYSRIYYQLNKNYSIISTDKQIQEYKNYNKIWKETIIQYIKTPEKFIVYHEWCFNNDYKKKILERVNINIKTTESKLTHSGCSIAKDFENNKTSQNLNILERYKLQIEEVEKFKDYIYDEECNYLSKKVFGKDFYDWDYIEKTFNKK